MRPTTKCSGCAFVHETNELLGLDDVWVVTWPLKAWDGFQDSNVAGYRLYCGVCEQ